MTAGHRLWLALAKGADLPLAKPVWQQLLGEDEALAKAWIRPSAERSSMWICGAGRRDCWRRVFQRKGELVAVCSDEERPCSVAVLRSAEAFLHRFDLPGLLEAFRRGLGLTGGPVRRILGDLWNLGDRRFGERVVRVFFVAEASVSALDTAALEAAGLVGVVICAGDPPVRVFDHAQLRGLDLRPLAGWATLAEAGAVRFDLDAFLLHHRFPGLVDPMALLSDRVRLLLDPMGSRLWVDRRMIPLGSRARLQWAFLRALADRAGRDVPRLELLPLVYEGFSLARAGQDWDRRLKQVREELPSADWPIQAVPGTFAVGGYRLDLRPDQVVWWSEPPPELPEGGIGGAHPTRKTKVVAKK